MARTHSSASASVIAGEEIRRARLERGWTQAQLAEALGVKPPQIARIEAGRANPTVGHLAAIARALDAGFELHLPILADQYRTLDPSDLSAG